MARRRAPRAGPGPGWSGAPSYRTSRAPSRSAPEIAHGPIIQPRSVNQNRASPRAQVERVGEVLGGLDREAAVDVDRALRPAGRARGVDQHVRRLGVGRRRGRRRRARRPTRSRRVDRLVPPAVALRGSTARRRAIAEPPDDDDPADRRRQRDGLVGDRLHRDDRAAAEEPVGGDEDARLAVAQPGATAGAP